MKVGKDTQLRVRRIADASLISSLALLVAAWLDFRAAFYVFIILNFILVHAIWVVQIDDGNTAAIDWKPFRLPFVIFGVMGCGAVLLFHPDWLAL